MHLHLQTTRGGDGHLSRNSRHLNSCELGAKENDTFPPSFFETLRLLNKYGGISRVTAIRPDGKIFSMKS
jgi:hypothetical protein